MNEIKFKALNILFFFLLLGSSYWALQKLNHRFYYESKDLIEKNISEEKKYEDSDISNGDDVVSDIGTGDRFLVEDTKDGGSENASQEKVENKDENTKESIHLNPEQEKLLKAIEKLKADKVYMKKGSKGTRVGTVQKFLNLYFNRSDRIDNDYGPHTIELVREFQKKEGLDVDGYAGPGTYAKMIELIKEKKVS